MKLQLNFSGFWSAIRSQIGRYPLTDHGSVRTDLRNCHFRFQFLQLLQEIHFPDMQIMISDIQ
jgi:hypothetical protein